MKTKQQPRIIVPAFLAQALAGALIQWEDETPLSDQSQGELEFYFDINTSNKTSQLLRKFGITDVSLIVNVRLRWRVTITLQFANSEPMEHSFVMHNPIFPMGQKFATERDKFYLASRLANNLKPTDQQQTYISTRFKAECIGA